MRDPVDLAFLFAEIMNSYDADRFCELIAEDYLDHNTTLFPGRENLIKFMSH